MTTDDGHVLLASEMGCLQFAEEHITHKWRLQPGKMLLIDLEQKRIISDEELKKQLATAHPYKEWLKRTQVVLRDLPDGQDQARPKITVPLLDRQQAFGYTQEDLKILMAPMAQTGQEAVGSMGNDAPISALSDTAKLLDTYFKQNFAQVTNPPIDPIREELVMSLVSFIGPRPNLLDLKGTSTHMRLEVSQPILTNEELERIRTIGAVRENPFRTATIDITYDVANGPEYMEAALDSVCALAERAVRDGYNIIILSDRAVSAERVPIPSLLATSATHHHLIRKGLRTSVGLVVESGEPREVHQFCTLAGYGAEAINPYLAFETLEDMLPTLEEKITAYEAAKRYIKAIDKGILKVMSKMGISTYQSYCGAQIFDAVGLSTDFVEEVLHRHRHPDRRRGPRRDRRGSLPPPRGRLRRRTRCSAPPSMSAANMPMRIRGEAHVWNAETVSNLQHAVRGNSKDKYRAFARLINEQSERLKTMRGLFRIRTRRGDGPQAGTARGGRTRRQAIVKRFATGAMSFGSISREAHTTLAIAMNRIGGKSNTGEGGEESDRFKPLPNGDSHALGHQAGGLRPLRRDGGISRQLRHDADQDGAGCQARRRRTIARPQGRQRHRQGAPFDAGRRPHLAAAASRHLFDRGSGPADLRSEERQPRGPGLGEARVRSGRRHRRGRRLQGPCRSRDDLRLRRRHRRLAADLDQACGLALGNRPRRNPADARRQRSARPHRGAGRWRHPHRPRRGDRRPARRRRDRLCHRAADRGGLHHDAQVPSEHLPGRRRHPGPGTAQALQGPAGACHQLLLLRRRGSARASGRHGPRAPTTN